MLVISYYLFSRFYYFSYPPIAIGISPFLWWISDLVLVVDWVLLIFKLSVADDGKVEFVVRCSEVDLVIANGSRLIVVRWDRLVAGSHIQAGGWFGGEV